MTIDEVKASLVKRLDELDSQIPVHTEQIKQGFKEPAFFVLLLNSAQDREVDRRYRRALLFDVHYFPSKGSKPNAECHSMADRLYEALEYVSTPSGLVRGSRMRHEVVGGVLHFFISFDLQLLRQKAVEPKMQTIDQEGYIK